MINFTFKTEGEYNEAYLSGYIDRYQMARIRIFHEQSIGFYDYPVHSFEEFERNIEKLKNQGRKFEFYASDHYQDIYEYV